MVWFEGEGRDLQPSDFTRRPGHGRLPRSGLRQRTGEVEGLRDVGRRSPGQRYSEAGGEDSSVEEKTPGERRK